jgi:hypothetical protein
VTGASAAFEAAHGLTLEVLTRSLGFVVEAATHELVGVELHALLSREGRNGAGVIALLRTPQPEFADVALGDNAVTVVLTVSPHLVDLTGAAATVGINEWALHDLSDPSDKSRSTEVG